MRARTSSGIELRTAIGQTDGSTKVGFASDFVATPESSDEDMQPELAACLL